ncbi:MAG: hypothetical protein GEV13_33210 [Rhodospirillales bacterium]|nr:hypothetical protein [Rhodospirillales bacterium]
MTEPFVPFTMHDAESLMGGPMPDDPDQADAWVRVLRLRLQALMGAEAYFERSLLAGALPDVIFDYEQRRARVS